MKQVVLAGLCLLLCMSSVFAFSAVSWDSPLQVHQNATGSIILDQDFSSSFIELQDPLGRQTLHPLFTNGSFFIDSSYFPLPGVYSYRFVNSEETFPSHGWFSKGVWRGNSRHEKTFEQFIFNQTIDDVLYCQPFSGTFNCRFEHFQAYEIARFAKLYSLTTNSSYEVTLSSLLSANWSRDAGSSFSCDPSTGFSCGDIADDDFFPPIPYSGAFRQAIIIKELWDAYSFISDSYIFDLAMNYSMSSPQSCALHQGDFDCGMSQDQGLLAQAYIRAYEQTRNSSFLSIGEGLLQEADLTDIHPTLLHALLLANKHLSYDYSTKITSLISSFLEDGCLGCTSRELLFLQEALLEAYLSSYISSDKQYEIYRLLYDVTDSSLLSCSVYDDFFRCQDPEIQQLFVKNYYRIAHELPSQTKPFFLFNQSVFSPQEPASFTFRMHKEQENPVLFIRDIFDVTSPFQAIPLSANGSVFLNESLVSGSTFLQFYFESGTTRYPTDSYFHFSLPLSSPVSEVINDSLFSSPLSFCEPFSSNASFSCRYEYMQGEYLSSLSRFISTPGISSTLSSLLFTSPDDFLFYSTCDPLLGEYACTAFTVDPLILFLRTGPYRSAQLSQGYVRAAIALNDSQAFLDGMLLFEKASYQEDCSVLKGNFSCQPDEVASLLRSSTQLLLATGDAFYKTVADQLLAELNLSRSDHILALGYHLSFVEDASFITDFNSSLFSYANHCILEPCSIEEFYDILEASWLAYSFFHSSDHFDLASDVLASEPRGTLYCRPRVQQFTENFFCEYPDQQARMLSAYKTLDESFVLSDIPNITLSIDSPSFIDFGTVENITCVVENVDSVPLFRGTLRLLTQQTSSHPLSVELTLPPGENFTHVFEVNFTTGGTSLNTCQLFMYADSQEVTVDNIGPIFNFTFSHPFISPLTNGSFLFNLTPLHGFTLLDVLFYINSSFDSNLFLFDDELPFNFTRQFVQGDEQLVFTLKNSSPLVDMKHNFSLYTSSLFNGSSNFSLPLYTLTDDLDVVVEANDTFLLESELLVLNLTNSKLFNLTNMTSNLSFSHNLSLEEITSVPSTLEKNDSFLYIVNVTYLEAGNVTFNWLVNSSEGLRFNKSFTVFVSDELLFLSAPDMTVSLQDPFFLPLRLENPSSTNLTSLLLNFNLSDSLVFTNTTRFVDNRNGTRQVFPDTVLRNGSFVAISDNLSEESSVVLFNDTYVYELFFTLNSSFSRELVLSHDSYFGNPAPLVLINNQSQIIHTCFIENASVLTSCQLPSSSFSSLNISLNSSLFIDTVFIRENYTFSRDRIQVHNDSLFFDYFEPNATFYLDLEFISFADNQFVNFTATSDQNSSGFLQVNIFEQSVVSSSPSSSGGGGFLPPQEDILFKKWNYTSLSSFSNLSSEELSFYFSENYSFEQPDELALLSSCLSISRVLDNVTMTVSIVSSCDLETFYVYEPFLLDEFIPLQEGSLIPVSSLAIGEFFNYSYFFEDNLSKYSFDNFFVHLFIEQEQEVIEVIDEEPSFFIVPFSVDLSDFYVTFPLVIVSLTVFIFLFSLISGFISKNPYRFILFFRRVFSLPSRSTAPSSSLSPTYDIIASLYVKTLAVYTTLEEDPSLAKKECEDLIREFNQKLGALNTDKSSISELRHLYGEILFLKEKIALSLISFEDVVPQEKSTSAPEEEPSSTEDIVEEEDTTHLSLFVKFMHASHLYDEKDYDASLDELSRLKKNISTIPDEQAQEREFIQERVNELEQSLLRDMDSSKTYKLKKKLSLIKEKITSLWRKEEL